MSARDRALRSCMGVPRATPVVEAASPMIAMKMTGRIRGMDDTSLRPAHVEVKLGWPNRTTRIPWPRTPSRASASTVTPAHAFAPPDSRCASFGHVS